MIAIFKYLFTPAPRFLIRKSLYDNKKVYGVRQHIGHGCYITIGAYYRLEDAQENVRWLEE